MMLMPWLFMMPTGSRSNRLNLNDRQHHHQRHKERINTHDSVLWSA
jgi:hypothetical protein